MRKSRFRPTPNSTGSVSYTHLLLMQFQADLTGVRIIRPSVMESTALGAAMFAGLAVGFWHSTDEICALLKPDRTFSPEAAPALMEQRRKRWHEAVRRSRHWIEE